MTRTSRRRNDSRHDPYFGCDTFWAFVLNDYSDEENAARKAERAKKHANASKHHTKDDGRGKTNERGETATRSRKERHKVSRSARKKRPDQVFAKQIKDGDDDVKQYFLGKSEPTDREKRAVRKNSRRRRKKKKPEGDKRRSNGWSVFENTLCGDDDLSSTLIPTDVVVPSKQDDDTIVEDEQKDGVEPQTEARQDDSGSLVDRSSTTETSKKQLQEPQGSHPSKSPKIGEKKKHEDFLSQRSDRYGGSTRELSSTKSSEKSSTRQEGLEVEEGAPHSSIQRKSSKGIYGTSEEEKIRNKLRSLSLADTGSFPRTDTEKETMEAQAQHDKYSISSRPDLFETRSNKDSFCEESSNNDSSRQKREKTSSKQAKGNKNNDTPIEPEITDLAEQRRARLRKVLERRKTRLTQEKADILRSYSKDNGTSIGAHNVDMHASAEANESIASDVMVSKVTEKRKKKSHLVSAEEAKPPRPPTSRSKQRFFDGLRSIRKRSERRGTTGSVDSGSLKSEGSSSDRRGASFDSESILPEESRREMRGAIISGRSGLPHRFVPPEPEVIHVSDDSGPYAEHRSNHDRHMPPTRVERSEDNYRREGETSLQSKDSYLTEEAISNRRRRIQNRMNRARFLRKVANREYQEGRFDLQKRLDPSYDDTGAPELVSSKHFQDPRKESSHNEYFDAGDEHVRRGGRYETSMDNGMTRDDVLDRDDAVIVGRDVDTMVRNLEIVEREGPFVHDGVPMHGGVMLHDDAMMHEPVLMERDDTVMHESLVMQVPKTRSGHYDDSMLYQHPDVFAHGPVDEYDRLDQSALVLPASFELETSPEHRIAESNQWMHGTSFGADPLPFQAGSLKL